MPSLAHSVAVLERARLHWKAHSNEHFLFESTFGAFSPYLSKSGIRPLVERNSLISRRFKRFEQNLIWIIGLGD